MEESVDLHEKASKENEKTLANLGPAEEVTRKYKVEIEKLSMSLFLGFLVWPYNKHFINPLSPGIKLKILLLCFHTFLKEVVGRSC